uniref:Zinc finger protein 628-like n=1 Tax=Diabrotica virgifera virgifera TaxID=50390 RepID=A0A6P7F0C6_DIAVI
KTAQEQQGTPQSRKPYQCPYTYCNKIFSSSEKLEKHEQTHTGSSPYKCEHCKKVFSSKFKLVRHALIHSDRKPFSCTVCDRTFHRKDHLKNHIKVHSPQKDIHVCDSCKKQYTSLLSYSYEPHNDLLQIATTTPYSVCTPPKLEIETGHLLPVEPELKDFGSAILEDIESTPSTSGILTTENLDASQDVLDEVVLNNPELLLLESDGDTNLPLPGFSQTFQPPPAPGPPPQ